MNQTTNVIFSFIGGVVTGSLATYAIMRRMKPPIAAEPETEANDILDSEAPEKIPSGDKPSFATPKTLDTRKVSYDGIVKKPDLEEVSKKYRDASFDKMNAEREYPEDDIPEDPDEEERYEEADALMNHIGQMEIEETEGFGHILKELNNGRADSLIYLISEDYAGEIYPLEDLTYYAKDDVLCDVTDAPVDSVEKLIANGLEFFGECGEDETKVYIRNATIGFEYEITRVDSYYGAHIYGVSDEDFEQDPPPKQTRKSKKAKKGEE